jgi:hypothetical protein
MLYPLRPTDLLNTQIVLGLLLSDCCLAQKYLSWSTLLILGAEGEQKLKVGPAATIQIPMGANGERPEVKYLQPDLKSEDVTNLVDRLIEHLLYTNNLSAGQTIGNLNSGNSSSGIAKVVDESQSTEDKEEQRKYFQNAEIELWDKFAHYMLPEWVSSGKINPEYTGAFSPDFELSINFQDMKPMLTDKEQLELIVMKLNNGLITKKQALEEMHPGKDGAIIDELLSDLEEEKTTMFKALTGEQEEEEKDQEDDNNNEEPN